MTNDVSRETPPPGEVPAEFGPAPEGAFVVFGEENRGAFLSLPAALERESSAIELIEAYGRLLASDGVVRGLIGPREVPRLWERHLINCGLLAGLLPPDCTLADVGSGAGLPGVVLAIARPDVQVTLIEPLLRRTTFLDEVVRELGLDNVEVLRGRASDFHGQRSFDVVTSRAVAPLDRLLGWCMPLVGPTGVMLAMKGSSVESEVAESRELLEAWGCDAPELWELFGPPANEESSPTSVPVEVIPTFALSVSWSDPTRVRLTPPAGFGSLAASPATRKKKRKPPTGGSAKLQRDRGRESDRAAGRQSKTSRNTRKDAR